MAKKKSKLSFNPDQATKRLLSGLKDRAQFVVVRRFGLDGEPKMTLEAIGEKYGITRERVRQIENFALSQIRKSEKMDAEKYVFNELRNIIHDLGGVAAEHVLFDYLNNDDSKNHIHFYLVLAPEFSKHREGSFFHSRWSVDDNHAMRVHDMLRDIHQSIERNQLLSEKEILKRVQEYLNWKDMHDNHKNEEVAYRWLQLVKALAKNPLLEWGHANSPNVRVRGVRDYAYLAIRKHGSPLHFREVADMIETLFDRPTHIATTHNELIKDRRFVLIGRGMYGLSEWGYKTGVVREVIMQILEEEGPIGKEEIIDKVLKERYLKRNTILVNLQNPKYFKRLEDGRYDVAIQK